MFARADCGWPEVAREHRSIDARGPLPPFHTVGFRSFQKPDAPIRGLGAWARVERCKDGSSSLKHDASAHLFSNSRRRPADQRASHASHLLPLECLSSFPPRPAPIRTLLPPALVDADALRPQCTALALGVWPHAPLSYTEVRFPEIARAADGAPPTVHADRFFELVFEPFMGRQMVRKTAAKQRMERKRIDETHVWMKLSLSV